MLIQIDSDTIKDTLNEYLDDGLLNPLDVARCLLTVMDADKVRKIVNAQMWFDTWKSQEPNLDECWNTGYDVAYETVHNEERALAELSLEYIKAVGTNPLSEDERAIEAFNDGFECGYLDAMVEREKEEDG